MRNVDLPATFVFWFIAPDDKAIGDRSKYVDYLKTGDETVLALKAEPAYYFLHPIKDTTGDDIRAAFDSSPTVEGEKPSVAQEIVMDALTVRAVRECLCGCTDHPIFVGQSKNKAVVNRVKWEIDAPDAEGVVEDFVKSKALCQIVFNFLLSRSVLTEEEKN